MLFKVTWYSFFVSRETNKHETDAVSDIDFNPGILKSAGIIKRKAAENVKNTEDQ